MRKFLWPLFLVLLVGCASVGREVRDQDVSGFTRGQTTEAEIVTKLGAPTGRGVNGDGHGFISYSYYHSQARPETFIPFVGAFVGGADTVVTTATFTLDASNRLVDYQLVTQQLGGGMGLAAGPSRERTDQPQARPSVERPTPAN